MILGWALVVAAGVVGAFGWVLMRHAPTAENSPHVGSTERAIVLVAIIDAVAISLAGLVLLILA